MKQKQCLRCKKWKPVDGFYVRRARPNGRQARCKECNTEYMREYRATERGKEVIHKINTSEKGRTRMRKYDQSPKGKARRKRFEQTEKYKKAHCEANQRYRKKHPSKTAAHIAISRAVASGKLPRVKKLYCSHCEKQAVEYHHHKGYEKQNRLNVIPLCKRCHINAH